MTSKYHVPRAGTVIKKKKKDKIHVSALIVCLSERNRLYTRISVISLHIS